ncbi:MAG: TetR/AcrR family transcriptional regulator [Clostridium sp.]|nr:TetR/AcrR family transcriptional regulator [Clostridium sp.]
MARKETITGDNILDTAFAMVKEEGMAGMTARRLAARAGCSTQPIFRLYRNMGELWQAVYEKSAAFFLEYYNKYPPKGKAPFVRLGMAYIAFAREEKHLFELLFLLADAPEGSVKKSIYELLNGDKGNVVYEINLAKSQGCPNPSELFMKMWIFIHGSACMTLTGDYDLLDEETMELLEQSYAAFAQREE